MDQNAREVEQKMWLEQEWHMEDGSNLSKGQGG